MISRDKYVIRRDTKCWEWQGAKTAFGYGRLKLKGEAWMAHRLMYTLTKGDIPEGMVVMHSCDNPCCINPEHLSVGTQKDNMEDCKAKGRLGPRGCKHNKAPKKSASDRRKDMVVAAFNRGWKPKAIAEYYKMSLVWVRRVIEEKCYDNQWFN